MVYTEHMLYSDSERAWLDRRALLIRERTGWSLPLAHSEAAVELARSRKRPVCKILPFRRRVRLTVVR